MVPVDFELTVMSSPTSGRRLEMLKSATGGSGVGSLTVKRFSVEVDSPQGVAVKTTFFSPADM